VNIGVRGVAADSGSFRSARVPNLNGRQALVAFWYKDVRESL